MSTECHMDKHTRIENSRKYLSITISYNLPWERHTQQIDKKGEIIVDILDILRRNVKD